MAQRVFVKGGVMEAVARVACGAISDGAGAPPPPLWGRADGSEFVRGPQPSTEGERKQSRSAWRDPLPTSPTRGEEIRQLYGPVRSLTEWTGYIADRSIARQGGPRRCL